MAAKKKSAIEARVGHPEAIIDDIIVLGKKLVKGIKNSRLDRKINKFDEQVSRVYGTPHPNSTYGSGRKTRPDGSAFKPKTYKKPVKLNKAPKLPKDWEEQVRKHKIALYNEAVAKRKVEAAIKAARIKANAPKGQKILDEITKKRRAGGSKY